MSHKETFSQLSHLSITPFSGEISLVENSKTSWTSRAGVILTLFTKKGMFGQGEASPLLFHSQTSHHKVDGEINQVVTELQQIPLKSLSSLLEEAREILSSKDLDQKPFLWKQLKNMAQWVQSKSALFALETAFLDLLAKEKKTSLANILGSTPTSPIPLSAWLRGKNEKEIYLEIEKAATRGIHLVKYKIGKKGAWTHEKRLLQTIKNWGGNSLQIRLDANQAWDTNEAKHFLQELAEEIFPEFVEEPTKFIHWPLQSPCRLALDESLQSLTYVEVKELLLHKRAHVLVLKPMVLGGISFCFSFGQLAKEMGIEVVLTHSLDGPIALATTAELAMALQASGVSVRSCGLDFHPGLDIWPRVVIPQIQGNQICAGAYHGHGITLIGT